MTKKPLTAVHRVVKKMPKPVRALLGYTWDYVTRISHWYFILKHIRGVSARDQLVLLVSALTSPVISLRQPGQWQDPVLLWDATVRVLGIGQFSLRRFTDDLWHVLPTREPSVLSSIHNYLQPGAVFVDAGANIGVYTVLASHLVGKKGRVISVEMIPETAHLLRSHLVTNNLDNVVVIEQALADIAGKKVVAHVPDGQHGQASISSGVLDGSKEVFVVTTTLEIVLDGIEQIALLKMDLEGVEELALAGAGDVLCKIRAVIFEDWGDDRLTEIFRAKSFNVERLDGNNCLAINTAFE